MNFKFTAVALLASVTMLCSESFGTDLLGRVLGRGCGCQVTSCEPDCGCEAAPVVEDCGCEVVADDCGCRSRRGGGLLAKLGSRVGSCNDTCGPTCPEPVGCGCEAAPVCEPAPVDCGCDAAPACEADPCGGRVGLLAKLRARCAARTSCGCEAPANDCGCEVAEVAPCCEPAPAPAPCAAPAVEDCGCDAAPACEADPCGGRVGLLAKLRARCGSRTSCGCEAPAADCGCEVVEAAPCCEPAPAPAPCAAPAVEDCGCEAAPACEADPCGGRVGLLAKLRARCAARTSCGCEAPADDCGCEVVEAAPCCEPAPAPAPCAAPAVEDCGCEAAPACEADPCGGRVGLLAKLRARCGSRGNGCGGCEAPAADCGCEAAPVYEVACAPAPAPCAAPAVEDCGCEVASSCDSGCGGKLRARLGSRRGGCGCEAAPARGCGCGSKGLLAGGCNSGCGDACNNGCDRLTLRDRLQGNRLPRDRCGKVRCGSPNDGCNPPCPNNGCDSGCGDYAIAAPACNSCGGGEVVYGDASAPMMGTPVEGSVVVPSVQDAAPAQGVIVPSVNEAQGEITPGDGASAKPVVNPNAFVIRRAASRN